MKYTYSISDNKVYCMTYYAGRTVKGVAKCDPEDTFNADDGMKLSKARCDHKVAKKRVNIKYKRLLVAKEELERAKIRLGNAIKYYSEAVENLSKTQKVVEDIESALS